MRPQATFCQVGAQGLIPEAVQDAPTPRPLETMRARVAQARTRATPASIASATERVGEASATAETALEERPRTDEEGEGAARS